MKRLSKKVAESLFPQFLLKSADGNVAAAAFLAIEAAAVFEDVFAQVEASVAVEAEAVRPKGKPSKRTAKG